MSETARSSDQPRAYTGVRGRATARAAANIAFIKYWGARNLEAAIPENPSISMTLRECASRCTAIYRPDADPSEDEVLLEQQGELAVPGPEFVARAVAHLDRLRAWAGVSGAFRIETANSFPAAAGMASSASGFSALTCAVVAALGRSPDARELSVLARRSGSGSAARSALGGYVEWPAGPGEEQCYAVPLDSDRADVWDLRDVIAVVETGPKDVSSLEGHRRAPTSPYFERRQELLPKRLQGVRAAIRERDFGRLGPIVEEEAIDLHLIAMSSKPPIFYWKPTTLAVLEAMRGLRTRGVAAWCTMDAGANVHVICEPQSEDAVAEVLADLEGVVRVIRDGVGPGPEVETGGTV